MNIFRNFFSKYDKEGYDKNGYDKDGFDKNGWNNKRINKITKTKYDKDGFDKNGWDINGINRETGTKYNKKGYDKDGFDMNGHNRETGTTYARNGFNRKGINKDTKTKYDEKGYDKDGFDIDGYNRYGFNRKGINKDTKTEYDEKGYDKDGFDIDGYNRYGYDRNRKKNKNQKKRLTTEDKLIKLAITLILIISISHLIYGIVEYGFLIIIVSLAGTFLAILPTIFIFFYYFIKVINFVYDKTIHSFSKENNSREKEIIEISPLVTIILIGGIGIFGSRMAVSLAKSSSNSIPDWAEPNIEEPIPDYSDIYDEYFNEYCRIKGNVNFDNGEKIYHLPGCPYYEETVINPDYGERWFCTEKEAIAAGWRKSYDCY